MIASGLVTDTVRRMKLSRRIVWDFLAICLAACVVAGCAFNQESDWRWKQWNPNYRLPYPQDY